jgi:nucleoside-diphosphate-sugar epimerase
MNILVTGGAGYVGTTLIPMLLGLGHKVSVVDNLTFGGDSLLSFLRNKNFEFIKGDIRDKSLMSEATKNQDIIIHLAAIVGYPACRKEPDLAKTVNMRGSEVLSSVLSKNQLVLYSSTGSNYGSVEDICTEETALNPLSLYGQTKAYAEQYLLKNNLTISLRFATGFGVSPRLRLDLLINDFAYKALTQGYIVVYEKHFMRTFIHVCDMARAFLFAIENVDKMKNQIYNVGSEEMNYSKEDICEMIGDKTGAYIHYADIGQDTDQRNYVVSYRKIKSLGYYTTVTIEEGIDELIKTLKVVEFKMPYANV